MQQEQGLAIARLLVKAGMPVFLAPPDPHSEHGFALPMGWQYTECDPSTVDQWRPGWALCAVTGRAFDLVDIDPRSGGTEDAIPMPHSYLAAETPSGGRHHFVSALGVASRDGVAPGVDLKSGTLEGTGRGFAFIAPTVRRSKVDGTQREYRWYLGPDGPGLPTSDQRAADGSGALLRARVMELRRAQPSADQPRRIALSAAVREFERAMHGLAEDVRRWAATGWGGEAHSGLLAATTHLARLNHAQAEQAFRWAFSAAGQVPDDADLAKLHSAIERAVPDIVIPDEQLSPAERFLLGGDSPLGLGRAGTFPGAGAGLLGSPDGPHAPGVFGEGRARFALLDEFEAEQIQPPEPIIDGVLYTGTKARLSAPSGAAKTWVVLDMLAHVANGMPWQGRPVRQCDVVYVAGEGAPSFAPRIRSWREYHGKPSKVRMTADIAQIGHEEWGLFILAMSESKPGVIVFDTASTITVGLEENSNKDANLIHSRLNMLIAATGACVLLVHHTGWEDKDRPRGASAMYGGMDTELILQRDGKSLNITLKISKQKYVEEDPPVRLKLVKAHGGLVVTPLPTGQNASDAFFGDVAQVEHETRVTGLLERIRAYYAAGGTSKPTARALVQVLRHELNVKASNDVLYEAARRYTASVGMPVEDVSTNTR